MDDLWTIGGGRKPVIALGVSGSIAAYKSAELVGKLTRAGAEVRVLMTANACRLVAPATFSTLSRHPVVDSLWDTGRWQPEHVELAELADLLVIAPATANIIGKLAHGIADDALSTFALSFDGSVIIAPAMNPRMWAHPAVVENCAILRRRGVRIVGPEPGRVACGDLEGAGRMSEPVLIGNAALAAWQLHSAPVPGQPRRRIVVTAGPTREELDPVRFLSNRSSGRMGYALAECAAAAGHQVVLISGSTELPVPAGCTMIPAVTAAEMAVAVKQEFAAADLLIMAAAVADFRPAERAGQKLRKQTGSQAPQLQLAWTEDILASLAADKRSSRTVVGFAAETEDLVANARRKLGNKKLDWLVANQVGCPGVGFDSSDNEVVVFAADGRSTAIPKAGKLEVAAKILELVMNVGNEP